MSVSIENNLPLARRLVRTRMERFFRLYWIGGMAAGGFILLVVFLFFLQTVLSASLKYTGVWPTLSAASFGVLVLGATVGLRSFLRKRMEQFLLEGKIAHARVKAEAAEVFTPLYEPILTVAEKTFLKPFLHKLPTETMDYELEIRGQKYRYQDHLFPDEVLYEGEKGIILVWWAPKMPEKNVTVITRRGQDSSSPTERNTDS